ncbi:hypothetical protein C0J52_21417 [Blattella germanica]|nr:hypothetical protein C0J52_21417 [Blattella germanica]
MSKTSSPPQQQIELESEKLNSDDGDEDQAPAMDEADVDAAFQQGEAIPTFTVVPPDGGPFVSALANRYGFRTVCMLGSALGGIGFVLSCFATSTTYLFFSYGILGETFDCLFNLFPQKPLFMIAGIGFGLVYVPAVIAVGFYFEKWRALATGIAVCGSGIGTFLMAPLVTALIQTFGWRGAFLIQAGLVLNCAVFGTLFRPLEPISVAVERVDANGDCEEKKASAEQLPLLLRIKMERDDQMRKCESIASFADNTSITADSKPGPKSRFLKNSSNNMYPTAAQVIARSTTALASSRRLSSHSLNLQTNTFGSNGPINETSPTKSQKRLSVPSYADTMQQEDEEKTASGPEETTMKKVATFTELLHPVQEERRGSDEDTEILENGDRTAITHAHSSVGYHMSVTRLPTKKDVEEELSKECKVCPEAVTRTLNTMLDMSLLRSPTFLLLSLSGFITMMGFYVPFMYLKHRAELSGMDGSLSVWLIPTIGITNTVGRVGCGVVSSMPGIDALLINNIALTIGGLITIFSGISSSFGYQIFYSSIFGLATACFASLRSILIVDLMGLEKLTNAFGLLLLFQGIAATIGSPLAGWFMGATGSYDASFYLSGSLILVSAILCYPLNRLNRWEMQRNDNQVPADV